MLAVEHNPFSDFPKHELLEVHRSKVSIHNAKAGYSCPTIRLPYSFSKLAGLSTRIYQTVHDGALAFLVIISKGTSTESSADPPENAKINARSPALMWRRSPVRIRPSPSFFLQPDNLETFIDAFSDTRIIVKKKHNEGKKLHNSNELDLPWQESIDLLPEDERAGTGNNRGILL